mgnify:FL=1
MTHPCPLCQSPLTVIYYHRGIGVQCTKCAFSLDVEAGTIIRAALDDHLRPLEHPHRYTDGDADGECGEIVDAGAEGERVTLCRRAPEAHPMSWVKQ